MGAFSPQTPRPRGKPLGSPVFFLLFFSFLFLSFFSPFSFLFFSSSYFSSSSPSLSPSLFPYSSFSHHMCSSVGSLKSVQTSVRYDTLLIKFMRKESVHILKTQYNFRGVFCLYLTLRVRSPLVL